MHLHTPASLWRAAALTLAAAFAAGTAKAREPGVLPTIPPGASMGVPIAEPAPVNGLFVSSRSGVASMKLNDAQGDATPTRIRIRDTVLQFAFVPGLRLAGGQYRAFVSLPYLDVEVEQVLTPFGLANGRSGGMGNLEIRPLDVTWETSPGIHVSAGASLFRPGAWSATRLANAGSNFSAFAPSVGLSYLRDGWNASAHLVYFANRANRENGYRSGDETHLNLTAMKGIGGGLSLGAVGYSRNQVGDDRNPRGAYFGQVAGRASSWGAGLSATQQLGPVNLNLMLSRDIDARNTGGGSRVWFNVLLPIAVMGQ